MDYSAVVFAIAIYVILYLVFLRVRPAVARLWLCFGTGVIGSLGLLWLVLKLLVLLRLDAYGPFGLAHWTGIFSILIGGPAFGWLVWHLTRPEWSGR